MWVDQGRLYIAVYPIPISSTLLHKLQSPSPILPLQSPVPLYVSVKLDSIGMDFDFDDDPNLLSSIDRKKVGNHQQIQFDDCGYGCGCDYDLVVKVNILGNHLRRMKLLFWEYRLGKGMLCIVDLGVGGHGDCKGI